MYLDKLLVLLHPALLVAFFPVFVGKLEHEEVFLHVISDVKITLFVLLAGNKTVVAAISEVAQVLKARERIPLLFERNSIRKSWVRGHGSPGTVVIEGLPREAMSVIPPLLCFQYGVYVAPPRFKQPGLEGLSAPSYHDNKKTGSSPSEPTRHDLPGVTYLLDL